MGYYIKNLNLYDKDIPYKKNSISDLCSFYEDIMIAEEIEKLDIKKLIKESKKLSSFFYIINREIDNIINNYRKN